VPVEVVLLEAEGGINRRQRERRSESGNQRERQKGERRDDAQIMQARGEWLQRQLDKGRGKIRGRRRIRRIINAASAALLCFCQPSRRAVNLTIQNAP
jgi:hypothetical protein